MTSPRRSRSKLDRFGSSPITGIHLWFDREITDLPHAALLDRTIQWMFHKSKFQEKRERPGSYVELVVSASKSLVQKSREEILEMAAAGAGGLFPDRKRSQGAESGGDQGSVSRLIRFRRGWISSANGTFAMAHESFWAGDWTATGWPATMEGAVRSGYLAAEADNSVRCTGQRSFWFRISRRRDNEAFRRIVFRLLRSASF